MGQTSTGDNKSQGRRVLEGVKYVGKNFWKVLPVGSAINYGNKREEAIKKNPDLRTNLRNVPLKEGAKQIFHAGYSVLGLSALFLYVSMLSSTGAWTLKQMKQYNEKSRIEQQIKTEHKNEVNYFYNRIFEGAENIKDSVDIYQKYGLPIKLLNPTLEEKERAIKQNRLENLIAQ